MRGYDAWRLQGPPEDPEPCDCGEDDCTCAEDAALDAADHQLNLRRDDDAGA